MAKEQELKLDATNEAPEKSGKKKLIIIIVLALLVLGGGGAAAWFFLLSGDADEDAVEKVVEEPKLPAQYVKLKPEFVVSFQTGTRQRFLQVSIEVMTRHQSVVDGLALHEPMIRNDVINIISKENFEELRTADARIALQEKLRKHIADVMTREVESDDIEAVLFTNLVMQ